MGLGKSYTTLWLPSLLFARLDPGEHAITQLRQINVYMKYELKKNKMTSDLWIFILKKNLLVI